MEATRLLFCEYLELDGLYLHLGLFGPVATIPAFNRSPRMRVHQDLGETEPAA